MDYQSFRNLVQEMMDAQKAYFDARRAGETASRELGESKALESLVRKELKRKDWDHPGFSWDDPGQPEKPEG
jgi:hypothetical protein